MPVGSGAALKVRSIADLIGYALFRAVSFIRVFRSADWSQPPYPSQCRSHFCDLRLSRVPGWVPVGSHRASWAYPFDLVVGHSPGALFTSRVWLSVADIG